MGNTDQPIMTGVQSRYNDLQLLEIAGNIEVNFCGEHNE